MPPSWRLWNQGPSSETRHWISSAEYVAGAAGGGGGAGIGFAILLGEARDGLGKESFGLAGGGGQEGVLDLAPGFGEAGGGSGSGGGGVAIKAAGVGGGEGSAGTEGEAEDGPGVALVAGTPVEGGADARFELIEVAAQLFACLLDVAFDAIRFLFEGFHVGVCS